MKKTKLAVLITALGIVGGVQAQANNECLQEDAVYNEKCQNFMNPETLKPMPDYVAPVDNSNPKIIKGVCQWVWEGDDMAPMEVRADGDLGVWTASAGGGHTVGGDGWELSIPAGNTFLTTWTLTSTVEISHLVIDGLTGEHEREGEKVTTVFDIQKGPLDPPYSFGQEIDVTPGSADGRPFTLIVPPTADLTATYSRPIFVDAVPDGGVPSNHDLYGVLDLEFASPFTGNTGIPSPMRFQADTDCVVLDVGLDYFNSIPGTSTIEVGLYGTPMDRIALYKDGHPASAFMTFEQIAKKKGFEIEIDSPRPGDLMLTGEFRTGPGCYKIMGTRDNKEAAFLTDPMTEEEAEVCL